MTVQVPLRQGGQALVMTLDEEDADRFLRKADGSYRYVRLKKGYAYIRRYRGKVEGRSRWGEVALSRLILGLDVGDSHEADHINRNRLDNRRGNLRIVTKAENAQNHPPHRSSAGPGARGRRRTSEHRGVCFDRTMGLWRGTVRAGGKLGWTGTFQSEAEAAQVTAAKRRELLPFAID